MGRIIVALCLGLVTASGFGCYSPPHPACGFICGTSGQCPADYTCNGIDNVCHLNGSAPGMICSIDAFIGAEPPPSEGPPFHVLLTTPGNQALMVSRSNNVLVQFDRSAMGSTLTNVSFLVVKTGVAVPGFVSYDDPSMTGIFTPTPAFPPGVSIGVMMTSDILSSQSQPLTPYSFSFTTIDDVPPTVVTTSPLDTATAVPVTTVISVTFSEPVLGVLASTFVVTQGATTITGTISTAGGITYTFTPDADLPAASLITVSLAATINDTAGNTLVPVQFTFTTQ
jgi:hypothetical protein